MEGLNIHAGEFSQKGCVYQAAGFDSRCAWGKHRLSLEDDVPVTGVDRIFGIPPGDFLIAAFVVLLMTALIVAGRS
jgi:hypothetical protein